MPILTALIGVFLGCIYRPGRAYSHCDISLCEDICVPTKTFCTFSNNKPWFTQKLWQLCQAKEEAYRSGDTILYSQARNTLTEEMKIARRIH